MSPITPHRVSAFEEPSPCFLEQARMHASTAKACLRRLSDWVNSVNRFQAVSLLISFILVGYLRLVLLTKSLHTAYSRDQFWGAYYQQRPFQVLWAPWRPECLPSATTFG